MKLNKISIGLIVLICMSWLSTLSIIMIEKNWGLEQFFKVYPLMIGTLAYLSVVYMFAPAIAAIILLIEVKKEK